MSRLDPRLIACSWLLQPQRADLPSQGRAVGLRLKVRRFFCENPTCVRKTFAEQFPEMAPASARRTLRQSKT